MARSQGIKAPARPHHKAPAFATCSLDYATATQQSMLGEVRLPCCGSLCAICSLKGRQEIQLAGVHLSTAV
eukprot:1150379-Pelagomonas_calceolata.AAC.5